MKPWSTTSVTSHAADLRRSRRSSSACSSGRLKERWSNCTARRSGTPAGLAEPLESHTRVLEERHGVLGPELEEVVTELRGADCRHQPGTQDPVVEAHRGVHVVGDEARWLIPLQRGASHPGSRSWTTSVRHAGVVVLPRYRHRAHMAPPAAVLVVILAGSIRRPPGHGGSGLFRRSSGPRGAAEAIGSSAAAGSRRRGEHRRSPRARPRSIGSQSRCTMAGPSSNRPPLPPVAYFART